MLSKNRRMFDGVLLLKESIGAMVKLLFEI